MLHFVGDIHQPLHSSDDNDAGGNDKTVTAPGISSNSLPESYVTDARSIVATQLSKAGARLAFVLNNALK